MRQENAEGPERDDGEAGGGNAIGAGTPKILDRLRDDLRSGRHHPRGTASATLIRKWGFTRVMRHIDWIRAILEQVEADEMELLKDRALPPMRKRTAFPGDLRRASRAPGGIGRTPTLPVRPPEPPSD